MSYDYSRLKATAERLLARFGKPGTLTLNIPAGGSDPWNPGNGGTTDQAVTVVQTDFSQKDRDGTLVQADDLMFLVSTAGDPQPELAQTLTVGADTWQVVRVMETAPGPVTMLWKLRCRK